VKKNGNGKGKGPTGLSLNALREVVANVSLMRSEWLSRILDPRRDIDVECGYPKEITPNQYRELYDRQGLAARIVDIWPEESWSMHPEVYETEDGDETDWEEEFKALAKQFSFWQLLELVDRLSGVGRFGVLALGLADGLDPSQPVEGVDLKTGKGKPGGTGDPGKLLYIRALDESCVNILQRESDITHPRYGKPLLYQITFKDHQATDGSVGLQTTLTYHWTRVIHIADNRQTSEVYGVPRMQVPYNRIYDTHKILSGSGEMFWRGAFPGLALEATPSDLGVEIDADSLKTQMESYMNGLQRYLSITGGSVKSLAPQVAPPGPFLDAQIDYICITLGVPKRIFLGSERGELASSQDARTWNKRVAKRQNSYLTPMVITPFVDRLMAVGALSYVGEFFVHWPDLNAVTDQEKAQVAVTRTQALAQYVSGSVDQVIPPKEYMTLIMEMSPEEVEEVLDAAEEYQEEEIAEYKERAVEDAELRKASGQEDEEETAPPLAENLQARPKRRG
jgi:hypothetical protein